MKDCPGCGGSFPATEEHFYLRRRRGRTELTPRCRNCIRSRQRRYNVREQATVSAQSARIKVARAADPQFFRERERRYRAARTPEQAARAKATTVAWRERNQDRVVRDRRRRYEAEGDAIRAAVTVYYRANPEKMRAIRASYKARRMGASGRFTEEDVFCLFAEQEGACFWCGSDLAGGYHVDHYLPLKRGGSNDPSNLVLSCQGCNTSRKDKLPDAFISYRLAVGAPIREELVAGR